MPHLLKSRTLQLVAEVRLLEALTCMQMEVRESGVQGLPQPHSECKVSSGYRRPCLKKLKGREGAGHVPTLGVLA